MGAFEALADPVRRRIVELLAEGEQPRWGAGSDGAAGIRHFTAGASQHLRVLRDHAVVQVRAEGARRIYALDASALSQLDRWLDQFRGAWDQPLDALETELARGQRERRRGHRIRASRASPA